MAFPGLWSATLCQSRACYTLHGLTFLVPWPEEAALEASIKGVTSLQPAHPGAGKHEQDWQVRPNGGYGNDGRRQLTRKLQPVARVSIWQFQADMYWIRKWH